ncbi:MAG TPA: Sec-independent protein translocase protein TatB [Acidimicrobiales bacterium]|nr:Sec-independent protein translocase protein TatB [Acidimicrobiales bacterium]
MGSIGPAEILVVLVVALVVLGPNRLPEAARSVGKALAELRRVSAGVQSEVREAFAEPPPTYPKPPATPDGPGATLAGTALDAPGTTAPPGTPSRSPGSPEQAEAVVVREPDPPQPA